MSKKTEFTYERPIISPAYLADTREVYNQIEYQPPIIYKNASRYASLRTIKDPETGKIFHESWKQKAIPFSSDDIYITVTNETENRLDLIAYQYYNSARYWWVIALANYLLDAFDVPVGTQLRIPPLLSLYQSGGVLNA